MRNRRWGRCPARSCRLWRMNQAFRGHRKAAVPGVQAFSGASPNACTPESPTPMAKKVVLKSERDLAAMRRAGRLVAQALEALRERVRPGVSTAELDRFAYDYLTRHGATPSFKGYHGYPASLCTSINEEVVHCIPKPTRILREGDIVGLDLGARLRGFHGASALTVAEGMVAPDTQRLLDVTHEALWK